MSVVYRIGYRFLVYHWLHRLWRVFAGSGGPEIDGASITLLSGPFCPIGIGFLSGLGDRESADPGP